MVWSLILTLLAVEESLEGLGCGCNGATSDLCIREITLRGVEDRLALLSPQAEREQLGKCWKRRGKRAKGSGLLGSGSDVERVALPSCQVRAFCHFFLHFIYF